MLELGWRLIFENEISLTRQRMLHLEELLQALGASLINRAESGARVFVANGLRIKMRNRRFERLKIAFAPEEWIIQNIRRFRNFRDAINPIRRDRAQRKLPVTTQLDIGIEPQRGSFC